MDKIVFVVGAGAECSNTGLIKMPMGNNFSYKTLFNDMHDEMCKALKVFYKDRTMESLKYMMYYPFDYNSAMFHVCVKRLLEYPKIKKDLEEKLGKKLNVKKNNSDDYKKIYSFMSKGEKLNNIDSDVINKIFFAGGVEQYFSVIVDPVNLSERRFWRVINYFWNSFFAILLPYTDYIYKGLADYEKSKYSYVLSHLSEILSFDRVKSNIGEFHDIFLYYKGINEIKNRIDFRKIELSILTTNYMPFVKDLTGIHTTYLSGEITDFEDLGMTIQNFTEFDKNELIFPYMLTQSPVKPIINSNQILKLCSGINQLDTAKQVFVLGYSIPENDMHILTMIRDYILKDEKRRLYYYEYNKDKNKIKKVGNDKLCKKLRLNKDEVSNRIIVYQHSGNEKNVIEHIYKQIICEKQ